MPSGEGDAPFKPEPCRVMPCSVGCQARVMLLLNLSWPRAVFKSIFNLEFHAPMRTTHKKKKTLKSAIERKTDLLPRGPAIKTKKKRNVTKTPRCQRIKKRNVTKTPRYQKKNEMLPRCPAIETRALLSKPCKIVVFWAPSLP